MNTASHKHGLHYLLAGLRLIFQPGLRRYVFIPMAINIIVYIILFGMGYHYIHLLITWVDHFLPHWLHWLNVLFWLIFMLAGLIFFVYTFTIVANIIGAPFNSFLSEKIEKQYTGQTISSEGGWQAALKEVPRTVTREWQKAKYYLVRAIILIVVSFIPGVNVVSSLLWFLFGSWMMAIQYLDYPMDNHKIAFHTMLRELHQHRLSTFGFGVSALVLSFIPLLNLIAMPASVAAATLMYLEQNSTKTNF